MIGLYLHLRLRTLIRLLKELKVFIPLIVLFGFFIGGIFIGNSPRYYLVIIYHFLFYIFALVNNIKMWNKTALSSHIISALTDVCDEISYIHKGKKVANYSDETAEYIEKEISELYLNL